VTVSPASSPASVSPAAASLDGRVALVTGGTHNLGLAAAHALANGGADLVLVTSSPVEAAEPVADELRKRYQRRVGVVRARVGRYGEVRAAVAQAIAEMGRVDIAVECAAIRPHSKVEDISLEEWHEVLETNLSAAFYFTRELLPGMRERRWGRLIHVSGADAFSGYPNRAHSVAAKAGLHGFTKALATEVGRDGITVNTIVPGAFSTVRDLSRYPGWTDEKAGAETLVGRIGRPDEFGAMCALVASDACGYMTGQAIHLNGGLWLA
jgi:NAD(P)-dependent dehydrogenase (short-subunit alcohol dehydrogenase family)